MDTTWIENLLNAGANAYSTVKTADALNHQQVSNNGDVYTNGQFNNAAGGISPTVLLIGAGVLLFMFFKD